MSLDELPQDWWHIAENEAGGYQYRTVAWAVGKNVETMLDACAESNHVTAKKLLTAATEENLRT